MTIACIGWGSLKWDPRTLPVKGEWFTDGPQLPLEFARKSKNGRITLVIAEGREPCPALWCELGVSTIEEAITALAFREEITVLPRIGRWTPSEGYEPQTPASKTIAMWAASRGLDGVVWTALGPSFGGNRTDVPPLPALLKYLRGLDARTRELAAEYVLKAPDQITTAYRPALTQELSS
jgi:hypothetical protein